ncbi:MAG: hypothetical protein KDB80_06700 [Planctomycetes bacterium]|nr:hypothetical protein [Planctomycetota bacterium]
MTTAGIASLTMAVQVLGKKASATMRRQHEDSCKRAMTWLEQNWTVEKNPNHGDSWIFYYLYGVERVGGLLGTEYVGDHPWYLEGAKFLLEKQADDGHWNQNNAEADTCFGLLFLARATAPVTGDARRDRATVLDSPTSPDVEFAVRLADDGCTMHLWLSSVAGTREGDRPAAWPEVRKVEYLVDGAVVATIEDQGPWRARPCFANHRCDRNGLHEVRTRVHVAAADKSADPKVLESAPLSIEIDYALEPWMLPAATARARNLILEAGAVASASSTHKTFHAENAIDGQESSGWMYDSPDKNDRTLTVRLRKTVRANTLRLSQTHGLAKNAGIHDRIERVAVQFDRREPFEVDLAPDETTPTVVRLDESLRIKRIVLRVLQVAPGGTYPGLGGFAEVGLEQNP